MRKNNWEIKEIKNKGMLTSYNIKKKQFVLPKFCLKNTQPEKWFLNLFVIFGSMTSHSYILLVSYRTFAVVIYHHVEINFCLS